MKKLEMTPEVEKVLRGKAESAFIKEIHAMADALEPWRKDGGGNERV